MSEPRYKGIRQIPRAALRQQPPPISGVVERVTKLLSDAGVEEVEVYTRGDSGKKDWMLQCDRLDAAIAKRPELVNNSALKIDLVYLRAYFSAVADGIDSLHKAIDVIKAARDFGFILDAGMQNGARASFPPGYIRVLIRLCEKASADVASLIGLLDERITLLRPQEASAFLDFALNNIKGRLAADELIAFLNRKMQTLSRACVVKVLRFADESKHIIDVAKLTTLLQKTNEQLSPVHLSLYLTIATKNATRVDVEQTLRLLEHILTTSNIKLDNENTTKLLVMIARTTTDTVPKERLDQFLDQFADSLDDRHLKILGEIEELRRNKPTN